jgi:hypothetical protein
VAAVPIASKKKKKKDTSAERRERDGNVEKLCNVSSPDTTGMK